MNKEAKIVLGVLVALLLCTLIGVLAYRSSPPAPYTPVGVQAHATLTPTKVPTATPTHIALPTEGPRLPITVLNYSGSSNHTTATFTIYSPYWTLTWTCQANSSLDEGLFVVTVYISADNRTYAQPVNTLCNHTTSGDTSTLHDPGDFYIVITAQDVNYTIKAVDPNVPLG